MPCIILRKNYLLCIFRSVPCLRVHGEGKLGGQLKETRRKKSIYVRDKRSLRLEGGGVAMHGRHLWI